MKAILQFTLPAEEAEFKAAQQGRDAKLALWQIDQRLREILKYGTPTKEEQARPGDPGIDPGRSAGGLTRLTPTISSRGAGGRRPSCVASA